MNKKYYWVLVIVLFIVVAAIFHFSSPNLADGDSFFYIRQAWRHRTENLFDENFPWMQYSVIKSLSVSLWYGFFILLIPFTFFSNLVVGLKVAGTVFAATTLFLYFVFAKRHNFKMSLLWPFLFFFSTPNILFRFLMVRMQLISIGLSILLYSLLIRGLFWPILITTFGIVWIHGNFAWLPFLLLFAVLTIKWVAEKRVAWRSIAGVILGFLGGWLLRPQPLNAARLFYIQIIQQSLVKQSGVPIIFGGEHFPLLVKTLFRNFTPFLVLWVSAIVLLAWFLFKQFRLQSAEEKIVVWSSLGLSVLFFLLTMFVARRAYDFWVAFGIIFVAAIFTYLIAALPAFTQKGIKSAATFIIIGIFIIVVPTSIYKNNISLEATGYQPDRLKESALWLEQNSAPGDIVFNPYWSRFQELFFWDRKNYYISGLDPIFVYAYNPHTYWKMHYFLEDVVNEKICGEVACTASMLEDTYEVLKKEFKARYIFLEKGRSPKTIAIFSQDTHYRKALETAGEVIFEIK